MLTAPPMELQKITRITPEKSLIQKACTIIKNGGVVMHPTDTCYGLTALAASKEGRAQIVTVKGRDEKKPISLIVSDLAMFRRYGEVTPEIQKLITTYLPGPLTIITKATEEVPAHLRTLDGTIGIRIPACPTSLALVRHLGEAILTTSANASGDDVHYSIKSFLKSPTPVLPALILDGGKLQKNLPSTIVRFENHHLTIVRQGPINIEKKSPHIPMRMCALSRTRAPKASLLTISYSQTKGYTLGTTGQGRGVSLSKSALLEAKEEKILPRLLYLLRSQDKEGLRAILHTLRTHE